jgi:hypothetical protein
MAVTRRSFAAVVVALVPAVARSQSVHEQCASPSAKLLRLQSTFIGQALPPFHADYSSPMSLDSAGDRQLSQSYGAYGGACLLHDLAAYVDVEMIRGNGISHASGLAGITNGDVLRQGSVDLGDGPYVARAFVRWTLPFASTVRDTIVRDADQMPGTVSARRLEVTAGKFALTDLFDVNRYANSTRTQFLDWVLFNNGAWDYAADTRGYSNGIAVAWISTAWSLRAGSMQMPTFANGNHFDNDIADARGDNVELTLAAPHDAVVRILAYLNHARMGIYDEAIAKARATGTVPDIAADDSPGRTKYGFLANAELPLSADGSTGVFARLGWSDGRNESFVFTEADRHASGGVQFTGAAWHRPADIIAVALVADGLSGPHRAYLAAGGHGFLLGDGALSYAPETIAEGFYRFQLGPYVALTPDAMFIGNPGHNRARGPAAVLTLRLRVTN